jgi:hypothetical protein
LRARHALALPLKARPIFEGKLAIMPQPEVPLVEPEEQAVMMVPVAEVTMFERHMTESEHEVAIAEFEHQPGLADGTEVSRLEPWDMSELECGTTVGEVPEVPRLERTMLSKDATLMEAMLSQVQLRSGMS